MKETRLFKAILLLNWPRKTPLATAMSTVDTGELKDWGFDNIILFFEKLNKAH